MANLVEISDKLRISYRSGRDDLVNDFYVPCLDRAVLYRRAAGYFTSSSLASAARGVASLVSRHGKMQLVASPHLEEADVEALDLAKENPTQVLKQVVERSLGEIESLLVRERLSALAWLIADGALEVRLALRLNKNGRIARGIYHEKIGIFTDGEGNHVAFAGSANETEGGLVDNFESIKVFCSWDDPQGRVAEELENFAAMWENKTPSLRVLEFTDVARDLLKTYQIELPSVVKEDPEKPGSLTLKKRPRGYQDDAIEAWFKAGRQGILAMATGTGKTLTALHLLNRLSGEGPLVAIITCPYVNLAEQWVRELADAGVRPLKCYGTRAQWQTALESGMSALMVGTRSFLVMVVVNKTFLSSDFQRLLRPDRVSHLLIADEMHNLGAEQLRANLNPLIRYRLGLSATPERHMDGDGTKALFDYFGQIVFTYTLAQAIDAGQLCRYHYRPVLVELNEEEAQEYLKLTIDIGRAMQRQSDDEPPNHKLKMLLLRRARLLASAQAKLPALREALAESGRPVSKALFYCGDGQVDSEGTEGDEFEERMMSQMEGLIQMLGRDARLRVARFSHRESMADREKLLVQIRDGRLDGLVAIRCLDEGIDLPDVCMGLILASSTNPRQFIQRRGRLLRRADGKNRAEIWDFIVRPPDLGGKTDDALFNLERRMFQRELARVLEFCQTAENGDAARHVLIDLRRRYNLLANDL
jgi:superfamily II DNA or RNA helicase